MAYDIGPKIGIEGESEFRKNINNINTNMRTLKTEMVSVASQFDKNDRSTEALSAKNVVLNKQIVEQKNKLSELEKGLKAAAEKYGENDKVTQGWKQSVNKANAELNIMERELKDNNKAIADFGKETVNTTNKTSKFSGAVSGLGKGLANVGKTTAKAALVGIKAIGVAAVGAATGMLAMAESTREYRNDLAKLEQNAITAGNSFDTMKGKLGELNALTGETDSSIEALSNLMATGLDDSQIDSAVDALSGAIIKFPDTLKIESLADGLQETLATGKAIGPFSELIERMGGNLDEFNEGLANATTQAEKQDYALKWLADSGLSEINKQYRENNKEMLAAAEAQFKLNDSLATLSDAVEPAISTLKGGLADVMSSLVGVITNTEGSTEQFSNSIKSFADNLMKQVSSVIPTLSTTMQALIPALVEGITDALPSIGQAVTDIMLLIVTELIGALPQLIPVGFGILTTLINGLIEAIPELMPVISDIMTSIVSGLLDFLPAIIQAAVMIILALTNGLIDALPQLIPMIPQIVATIVEVLAQNMPLIIDAALQIILALGLALVQNLPVIIESTVQIIGSILMGLLGGIVTILGFVPLLFGSLVEAFNNIEWGELGKSILDGIKNGITGSAKQLAGSVVDAAKNALTGAKKFLGIASPSRLFKDQVGLEIGAGMAAGISDSAKKVNAAMNGLNKGLNSNVNVVGVGEASLGAAFNTPSKSIVEHKGTLRIEGVNDKNQLLGVVEIVMDELRREVRTV